MIFGWETRQSAQSPVVERFRNAAGRGKALLAKRRQSMNVVEENVAALSAPDARNREIA